MSHSLINLKGYRLQATDGLIGEVENFYFDDHAWVIRYLVAHTSVHWYAGWRVLISPISLRAVDDDKRTLSLTITCDQVRESPNIDTDRTVSRQHEADIFSHFDYFPYWHGPELWGDGIYPTEVSGGYVEDALVLEEDWRDYDPHLRSIDEILGYHLHATDGDIGHITNVVVDERTWAIQYLVVETGHWWQGADVHITPQSIKDVSWSEQSVTITQSRDAIKKLATPSLR